MRFLLKFSCLILIIILLVSCQNRVDNSDKIKIATAIVPVETYVKKVGGELVEVETMIPPGNSPANYAPSPKELTQFSDASIYFSIGVPADTANILPEAKNFNPDIRIVRLHNEVKKVYEERKFSEDSRDPHIWLSPKRVKIMARVIAEELAEIDNDNKDFYRENARQFIEELNDLDKEIKKSLSNLENRTFIVYHPSFGYFADDYGLEMIALQQEGKDATPERINEIIEIARKQNIKNIFFQAEIDSRQSQAIAEEIGGKTVQVEPLAADYIENMKRISNLFNK